MTSKHNSAQNSTVMKRGSCECIATWRPPDGAPVGLGCLWTNICTAHAHKLLIRTVSFRSKFWHRR